MRERPQATSVAVYAAQDDMPLRGAPSVLAPVESPAVMELATTLREMIALVTKLQAENADLRSRLAEHEEHDA
jgi:hypothetical protein